jgi:hypothetical protein
VVSVSFFWWGVGWFLGFEFSDGELVYGFRFQGGTWWFPIFWVMVLVLSEFQFLGVGVEVLVVYGNWWEMGDEVPGFLEICGGLWGFQFGD